MRRDSGADDDAASRELREKLGALLQRERLAPSRAISHLDTPRRLAVLASGIPHRSLTLPSR